MIDSVVSIVNCKTYDPSEVFEKVARAIELIGGNSFEPGRRVLIKPNVLGPFCPEMAVTTHPEIVRALVKRFQFRGLEVCLGESSGFAAAGGTLRALRKSGLSSVCEEEGIIAVDFDKDERVNVSLEGGVQLKQFPVAKTLTKSDYLVNVPKLKTHSLTGYTGAIKNLFGVIPGRTKSALHHRGRTLEEFCNILVDIYQGIKTDLTLMDAVIGMEGRGPTHGSSKKIGLILCSQNGAALDYVASEIVGYNPLEIEMIRIAKDRRLFDKIELVGDVPKKINIKKPSVGGMAFFGWFSKSMQPSFEADKETCRKCYQCVDRCPEQAIEKGAEGFPVWDMGKCITCYCCDELCPSDAVIARKSLAGKIIDRVIRRYDD